jgi:hypothetical protein
MGICTQVGHIRPAYRASGSVYHLYENGTLSEPLDDIPVGPMLLPGTASVTETFIEARLEIRRLRETSNISRNYPLQ